jgi:hypothetical protein
MSVNFKQLLETSYIQVSSRLEEMQRFFAITRTFALKTNGHLKILTNLVNDLVDSEDMLHLVDTELTVHTSTTRNTYISQGGYEGRSTLDGYQGQHTVNVNLNEKVQRELNSQAQDSNNKDHYQTSTNEKTKVTHNYYGNQESGKGNSEDQIVNKIIENFKQENSKLWDHLKKGDNDVDFIKTIFEKLLESYANKDQARPSCVHQNENMHSAYCNGPRGCLCHSHMIAQQPIPIIPMNGSHSVYVPQSKNFYKSSKKVHRYSHKLGSEDFDEEEDEEDIAESVKGFKEELGKLNKEIKKLSSKKTEDNGLQDMLRKFIDLKSENERIVKEKDDRISNLIKELNLANERVDQLRSEISYLKTNNKMLEETIHDIFKTQNNTLGTFEKDQYKSLFGNEKQNSDYEKEIDKLRDDNYNLQIKIEEIKEQLRKAGASKDQIEFYKSKMTKLKRDLEDADSRNKDLIDKNQELYELVEKKGGLKGKMMESESKTMSRWETDITSPYDDFIKCIYSQADYIETGMESVFQNSIFRH